MAVNPLEPFTCPEAPAEALPASSWSTLKAIFDGTTSLRFEVGEPANLRLTLTFSGLPLSATGVEDVADLIEGFQLDGEASVFCDRIGFSLVQIGDVVFYRDADTEVSLPRGAYDRLALLVTDLIQDQRVHGAFEEAYRRLARATRAAAWHPSHVEG